MVSKAYRIPSSADRLRDQQKRIRELQAQFRNRNTPRSNAATAFAGVSAGGDIGGTGNFLRNAGAPMIGPLALNPPVDFTVDIDENNTIDIGQSSSNSQYSSNIQIEDTPTSTILDIVKGAAFDGQLLFVRTFAPNPITIRTGTLGNGGNIQTPNDADVILGNLQTILFIYDDKLVIGENTGGTWRLLDTLGGDNLGDHTATEALKMQDNAIFLDTALQQSIIALALANNHIVPVGGAHDFFVNDTVIPKFGITETFVKSNIPLNMNGNSIILDSGVSIESSVDNIQFLTNGTLRMDIENTKINMGVTLDINNLGKIINVLDPTNPQDVATKFYVDNISHLLSNLTINADKSWLGFNITDFGSIGSNAGIVPGSGFIRMGTAEEIRMKNPTGSDDLVITSGNDGIGNQAIIFKVASGEQLTISEFDIDVKDNDIVNTGDIVSGAGAHQVGDSVDFYNQMHSQFFVPEGSTIITNRFGFARNSDTLYVNYEDTVGAFGIFQEGIQQFIFQRTNTTTTELLIGEPSTAGQIHQIRLSDGVTNFGLIHYDDLISKLIINAGGIGTSTDINLRVGLVDKLVISSIESKFFSDVNVNSQDVTNVRDVFADTSGLAVIGEFQPSNGGFDYIMRSRLTWESNLDTFIQMSINGIDVISDDDINIKAENLSSNINIVAESVISIVGLVTSISGTNQLLLGAGAGLDFNSLRSRFSGAPVILSGSADNLEFQTAISGITLAVPIGDNIKLFNDSDTSELSVKKSGGEIVSLEKGTSFIGFQADADLDMNTFNITNVRDVFADTSGLSVIGDFLPNGGFDYIVRDTISWEAEPSTRIAFGFENTNISLITDGNNDNISIKALGSDSDIDLVAKSFIRITTSNFPTATISLNPDQIVITGAPFLLSIESKFIGFLNSFPSADIAPALGSGIFLFNNSDTGELSVKKNGNEIVSLEGGGVTEPIILGINTLTPQTLPAKTTISWDITNPQQITLDRAIEFEFTNLPSSGEYEGILVIIDIDGTGGFDSPIWPTSLLNPPIIPTTPLSRFSVMLYTIDGGIVVTHATSVGSSNSGGTSFIGFAADADLNMNTFDVTSVDRLLFDTSAGDALLPTDTGITGTVDNNIHYNVSAGKQHIFTDGNVEVLIIAGVSIGADTIIPLAASETLGIFGTAWDNVFTDKLLVDNFIDLKEISTPSNPNADTGRLYVKDVSTVSHLFFRDNAGAETDLLDVGSGANTSLSNLTATAINQTLIPDIDANRSLGSSTNRWSQVYTRRLRFPSAGSILSSDHTIARNNSDEMQFNVTSGHAFIWTFEGGSPQITLDSNFLELNGVDLVMNNNNIFDVDNIGESLNPINNIHVEIIRFPNNNIGVANIHNIYRNTDGTTDSLILNVPTDEDLYINQNGSFTNTLLHIDTSASIIEIGKNGSILGMNLNDKSIGFITNQPLEINSGDGIIYNAGIAEQHVFNDEVKILDGILMQSDIIFSTILGNTIDFFESTDNAISGGTAVNVPNTPFQYIKVRISGVNVVIPVFLES